jgi:hypothetical protein
MYREGTKREVMGIIRFVSILAMAFFIFAWSGAAAADEKVVERDTDKDGKIDQIGHFDTGGKLIKLELDTKQDGKMDRFQYSREAEIVRVEGDKNGDGKIDSWDHFEAGKRVRNAGKKSGKRRRRGEYEHDLVF